MIELNKKTEPENTEVDAPVDGNKKPYETPQVTTLGTLLEITRGGEFGTPDGANAGSFGTV